MLAIAVLPIGLLLIAMAGALLAIRAPSGDTSASSRPPSRSGGDEPLGLRSIISLLGIVAVGLAVMLPLMLGLGKLVERFQGFDTRAWNWFVDHRVQGWYDLMGTVTQLGNSWLNRGVAVGVLLTLVVVVRQRWLTAVALTAMLFAAHYMVVLTTSVIDRTPPPGSGGTYPSGGCARVIAIYGLVAFVLLRETNAGRRTSIAVWTVVAPGTSPAPQQPRQRRPQPAGRPHEAHHGGRGVWLWHQCAARRQVRRPPHRHAVRVQVLP